MYHENSQFALDKLTNEALKGGERLIQNSTIRTNIKRLCMMQGISIPTLEKAVGLGNGTVCRWSTSSPSVANLQKVADYFHVPIGTLLREEPNEEPEG